MTPIEKNIIVLDEQGNEYEATYPKRAKGLVKSGRARFVDDKTICLACPPVMMEDNVMSEEKIIYEEKVINEETEPQLTMGYVLAQIENIAAQTAYLNETVSELGKMFAATPVAYAPPDIAGQAKAKALGDIVRCRETTNQQLLKFYEKVYDDLNLVKLSDGLIASNEV